MKKQETVNSSLDTVSGIRRRAKSHGRKELRSHAVHFAYKKEVIDEADSYIKNQMSKILQRSKNLKPEDIKRHYQEKKQDAENSGRKKKQ